MAGYTYFLDNGGFVALYCGSLRGSPAPLSIRPGTHKGVDSVDETSLVQVLYVGDGIRYSPGNMLVVPNHDAWSTRKTCSNHINISCYQVAFVPDGWSSLSQVRIVTQDR